MPALAADIALATRRDGRALVTAEDATVKSWAANARDGTTAPQAAWWNDPADAQTLAEERLSLLKLPRRRFVVQLEGLRFDLFPTTRAKVVRLEDSEHFAAGLFMVGQVSVDLAAGVTVVELWG